MPEFTIDSWTVSPERNTVMQKGKVRRLEPRVMDLLVYLAKHAGEVVGREQIIESVWPHTFVSTSALQSAISVLRKALDDDPRNPSILETIPKRGYRLIAESTAARPVVAVLPFENLTGSPERQYLADGLSDVLITELGRYAVFDVISRQSAMAVRNTKLTLPEVASKLNATAIVEGSILPGAETVVVNVQLIDAKTDTHLWAEQVGLEPGQLFEQQRSVAAAIARQLSSTDTRLAGLPADHGADPEALNCYLLGRFHWYKLDPQHFPLAFKYFQQAVSIEPGFSAAYAGIADVWGAMGYWGVKSAADVRDTVREAAEKALALDPMGAEANMLVGAYHFHIAHDWQVARTFFEKAVKYNPSLSHARLLFGLFLGTMGEADARAQFDKAKQLDPLNPSVAMASAMHAAADKRTADAIDTLGQTLELDPLFPPAHELRADLAWVTGAADALLLEQGLWQADEAVSQALTSASQLEAGGRLEAAANVLQSRRDEAYVSPRVIARLYSLAAATDTAIDVLLRAIDASDLMQPDLVMMMPAFEPVRRHPRFEKVREALRLPRVSV